MRIGGQQGTRGGVQSLDFIGEMCVVKDSARQLQFFVAAPAIRNARGSDGAQNIAAVVNGVERVGGWRTGIQYSARSIAQTIDVKVEIDSVLADEGSAVHRGYDQMVGEDVREILRVRPDIKSAREN